ncbi:MAG TPA: ADP-ribosylation factor-like protein [Geothrix sp.]|nr:ADP-ribosylation factor-like protein [Geothrix sp.]
MVFFNHATRQMTAKIVYYGPGLCGKTTNLATIYGKTSQKARGEMVSLNTETDRTLFFDLLPMDVGMVGGFKTKLQLYTVPGQVFYNSTRKLVLKGVDGIVFVVDSQSAMFDACKESCQNLEENLRELGLNLHDIPMVFQWNKRDLKNVVPVEELEAAFNTRGLPSFQSVASDGTGVFETLRGITKLALAHIKTHVMGDGVAPGLAAPIAAAPPPAPVAPPPPAPAAPPVMPPTPSASGALALSDLPSVTDLLDFDSPSSPGIAGMTPLPDDDDDTGFYIEAPTLPEVPDLKKEEPRKPEPEPRKAQPEAKQVESAPPKVEPPSRKQDSLPKPPEPEAKKPEPATHHPLPREAAQTVARAIVPPPAPVTPKPEHHPSVPHHPKPAVKVDPFAALTALKAEAKRPAAGVKVKPLDHKDAINTLLGELTQVGRLGAPSVLRLELPESLDGQEVEVIVQVRKNGETIVEGRIQRNVPAKASTAKLSVELKQA